jgi:hypothetical protein
MKIIDMERKGNVVRFYLGEDTLKDWWGDDWNDYPYDANAERVYSEFIAGYVDKIFDFDTQLFEPISSSVYPASYSKNNLKERLLPCLIAIPPSNRYVSTFIEALAYEGKKQVFYFGDSM